MSKPLIIKVSGYPAGLPDADCYTPLDVNGHEHAVYVVTKSNDASGNDPSPYGARIIEVLTGYAELQAEIESNVEKLSRAIAWIAAVPHSDNCFVSDHYDGDPGNRCNCGKDSIVEYLNESQPQSTAVRTRYQRADGDYDGPCVHCGQPSDVHLDLAMWCPSTPKSGPAPSRIDAPAIAAAPELVGKKALVLYFETEADRDEMISACKAALPNARTVKVP